MRARYTAQAIANFFLWQEQITQMKLHKLLYYAAGWHLGFTREPLFDEDIEAWQYGPVVPSIYLEFRSFGARPIDEVACELVPGQDARFRVRVPRVEPSDEEIQRFLGRVWKVYGSRTAAQLSGMTHAAGGPWAVTRAKHQGATNAVIPKETMRLHFEERIKARHMVTT